MNVQRACELIRCVTYKPGWRFEVAPYDLYQDVVVLTVGFDAPDTDVRYAPAYDGPVRPQRQSFFLDVSSCVEPRDLWDLVLHCVIHLELHEVSEFFATDAAFSKPYHRHTTEGRRNWLTRPKLTTQDDLADVTIVMHRAGLRRVTT